MNIFSKKLEADKEYLLNILVRAFEEKLDKRHKNEVLFYNDHNITVRFNQYMFNVCIYEGYIDDTIVLFDPAKKEWKSVFEYIDELFTIGLFDYNHDTGIFMVAIKGEVISFRITHIAKIDEIIPVEFLDYGDTGFRTWSRKLLQFGVLQGWYDDELTEETFDKLLETSLRRYGMSSIYGPFKYILETGYSYLQLPLNWDWIRHVIFSYSTISDEYDKLILTTAKVIQYVHDMDFQEARNVLPAKFPTNRNYKLQQLLKRYIGNENYETLIAYGRKLDRAKKKMDALYDGKTTEFKFLHTTIEREFHDRIRHYSKDGIVLQVGPYLYNIAISTNKRKLKQMKSDDGDYSNVANLIRQYLRLAEDRCFVEGNTTLIQYNMYHDKPIYLRVLNGTETDYITMDNDRLIDEIEFGWFDSTIPTSKIKSIADNYDGPYKEILDEGFNIVAKEFHPTWVRMVALHPEQFNNIEHKLEVILSMLSDIYMGEYCGAIKKITGDLWWKKSERSELVYMTSQLLDEYNKRMFTSTIESMIK